ncbi:MAG: nitronate monooxygenase [Synergistaceae bacterium]|nr:nitronate monooxygenase [Synergistaceae bacterium]
MMRNRLKELFGIEYPIIQGGMAHVSSGAFAAAVSEAGALGTIATAAREGAYVREQIREARALTRRPLNVNIMLANPYCKEVVDVILDEGVSLVTTGAGSPAPYMKDFTANGCKVISVVPHVRAAVKVEDLGVAAVVAEGGESGGHVGSVSTMVLVAMVSDAVSIPVIAAGGIADGKGFMAAMALGAVGVQIGTAFLATRECPIHQAYKERLLAAKETDTVITGLGTKDPVRCLRNQLTDNYFEMASRQTPFEELIKPLSGSLARAVGGDMETGSLQAGQIAGMLRELRTVRELIDDVMSGAEMALEKIAKYGSY